MPTSSQAIYPVKGHLSLEPPPCPCCYRVYKCSKPVVLGIRHVPLKSSLVYSATVMCCFLLNRTLLQSLSACHLRHQSFLDIFQPPAEGLNNGHKFSETSLYSGVQSVCVSLNIMCVGLMRPQATPGGLWPLCWLTSTTSSRPATGSGC